MDARRLELAADPRGTVPEEVLVLEIIGDVEGFVTAVRHVRGLEWLAEIEADDMPPDEDFVAEGRQGKRPGKDLKTRLFLVFSDQRAMQELLALWQRWLSNDRLGHGFSNWEKVFARLHAIRPWGTEDRLNETGILDDWRERLAHGQAVVPVEIELWYRQEASQRGRADGRVTDLVAGEHGRILQRAVIDEIQYHGLLAELPVESVERIVQAQDAALVRCEQVQFFRAAGQMAVAVQPGEQVPDDPAPAPGPPAAAGEPIAALLDGLPLQGHQRLLGRLIVDDPEGLEATHPAADRVHGTAMASLIVNGELDSGEQPLRRPLFVRPILQPHPLDWRTPREESVSERVLVVDLLHRAIRRILEGEGAHPATAPTVRLLNLSIGIRDRPFDGFLSPLARLLDWLSWKYQVLFLVSAGNHGQSIQLAATHGDLAGLDPEALQREVLRAVAGEARIRRLLSPAEAMNAVTVASCHVDQAGVKPIPNGVDPYVNASTPSPVNAQGLGYRRSIKPDILCAGGRVVLAERLGRNAVDPAVLEVSRRPLGPGQRVAAPGAVPGDLSNSVYTIGTSNATALATRAGVQLLDVVQQLRDEPGGALIDTLPQALWIKTLLVHGANWGEASETLEVLRTEANSRGFKEYLTRFLGYGMVDRERVSECTAYRVTAVSGGTLGEGEAHIHRLPLPPSLGGRVGLRRLTITLGWFTPVNPRHRAWRQADLWFNPPAPDAPPQVSRKEADWRATQRGTIQHEILEGERAAPFVDGDAVEVQVSCRGGAGALAAPIPYTLAITLEVAESIGVTIYEEVRERVLARVLVAPRI